MKYVIAVIQPAKLDIVRDALQKAGVNGVTVSDAQGYGRQKGHTEVFRGHEYVINFVRKVKLEIACDSERVDAVVAAIAGSAKSDGGKIGDGKIFVFDLGNVIRIRTGESGHEAI